MPSRLFGAGFGIGTACAPVSVQVEDTSKANAVAAESVEDGLTV
jgi:hypothetical protein